MGVAESRAAFSAAVSQLESAMTTLREEYGDTIGVRRLSSDVRRLADDLDELGDPQPGHQPPEKPPLETVSDTPYDPAMWAGADDEGLGAPDRHAP